MNIRKFLRLQTDGYLTTLRDAISSDLSANVEYTSLSMSGKSVSQKTMVRTVELADALVDVLLERGLQGSDYKAKTRMTRARFA
jgi:hypothetical protein